MEFTVFVFSLCGLYLYSQAFKKNIQPAFNTEAFKKKKKLLFFSFSDFYPAKNAASWSFLACALCWSWCHSCGCSSAARGTWTAVDVRWRTATCPISPAHWTDRLSWLTAHHGAHIKWPSSSPSESDSKSCWSLFPICIPFWTRRKSGTKSLSLTK